LLLSDTLDPDRIEADYAAGVPTLRTARVADFCIVTASSRHAGYGLDRSDRCTSRRERPSLLQNVHRSAAPFDPDTVLSPVCCCGASPRALLQADHGAAGRPHHAVEDLDVGQHEPARLIDAPPRRGR